MFKWQADRRTFQLWILHHYFKLKCRKKFDTEILGIKDFAKAMDVELSFLMQKYEAILHSIMRKKDYSDMTLVMDSN